MSSPIATCETHHAFRLQILVQNHNDWSHVGEMHTVHPDEEPQPLHSLDIASCTIIAQSLTAFEYVAIYDTSGCVDCANPKHVVPRQAFEVSTVFVLSVVREF